MDIKVKIIILASLLFSIKCDNLVENENNGNDYVLVWSDEFSDNGLPDSSKWNYEKGFIRNEEAQWYQSNNAWCENGYLIIEGRKEKVENPNYDSTSSNWKENRKFAEYTSSNLTTMDKHNWKFGRFEMRARIDTRDGLWPAFWTKGIEGKWPFCGEIDIMEYFQNKLLASFFWGGKNNSPIIDTYITPITEFEDSEWKSKFHTWELVWTIDELKIFLDGNMLNSVLISETYNKDETNRNPFLQEHYIILNLAIGGTAGGDPLNTDFPVRYEIDYIRIYQKL